MSWAAQKRGARAKDANSMKPTKNGPRIVRAIPVFLSDGVSEANAATKPTMAKVEKISQYRTFPPQRTIKPAQICPSAVEEATVQDNHPAYVTSFVKRAWTCCGHRSTAL